MSVVATAIILGALVALLVKVRQVRTGSAIVCVLFGLVLGATPIGPAVNNALSNIGTWVWGVIQSW